MRTQIIETESLCLLPTQMPRPASYNTVYNRGDGMCALCHGAVRLLATTYNMCKCSPTQLSLSLPKRDTHSRTWNTIT